MIRFGIILAMGILIASCGSSSDASSVKVATEPLPDLYAKHNIYVLGSTGETKRATEIGQDRYYETGVLVDGKKEGPWIYYYEKAGTPKIVANYENDTLNGPYTEYYEMGWIRIMTNCKGGEFDGEYKEFTKSVLTKKQTFVQGKLEGEAMTYYPETGVPMMKLNYKDGKQHGTATYYNEEGVATQEYIYENGEQVSSKEL